MFGFQAEGAAPLVHGAPVENPETVASAIRIGNPARWEEAMNAVTALRGEIRAVSDDEIIAPTAASPPRASSASRRPPRRWPACPVRRRGEDGVRAHQATA